MTTLIGLIAIYSWIHGIIIVAKKIKDTTQYENIVLIVAAMTNLLFVIGMLMK